MAKCSTASACNNPSDSVTEIIRLEQFDYYNQKQSEVLYVNMENMDMLLFFNLNALIKKLSHP